MASRRTWLAGVFILLCSAFSNTKSDFDTATADEYGVNGAKLDELRQDLAARGTKAFLVLRHDRIIYEWYGSGVEPTQLHGTASLAKALVGGMSLLVALNDGRIGVDDPAWKYIPHWKDDPLKSKITIRHLATHSSGLEDAEQDGKPHAELEGWKGAFWRRDPDPFSISIRQAPVLFEPGTRYAYSNPGMAALAYAVTASLKGGPHPDIQALLRERIMVPLGLADSEWSIGYRQGYEVNGLKLYANWGGGSFTPRAVARVAQLMLHRGRFGDRELVGRAWTELIVKNAGTPLPDRSGGEPAPASGLAWYTNSDGIWPSVPRDAFAGAGARHQVLLVVPSLGLIVVRNGETLSSPGEGFWAGPVKRLFDPLMAAIQADASPYPKSKVITRVEFAPASSIVRDAIGSDNWPITWGDDDRQYTAYGDGWGFEPRTDRKLSLGFAAIGGSPTKPDAKNLRSPGGERLGDGRMGPKASGILMVDGVLYMWVRNVGNAQLLWSEDHGRTWHWDFRFETSFGSPAFLNFGKNYDGARDDYVYVYSQDGPSAYESDDHVILARVSRQKVRDRSAYEFFVKLDSSHQPVWARSIERRGVVFSYPRHVQRVDAVYNPGIKRYLLAAGFNHRGGWGIFDAPEPWGPWTTAFHTESWDIGGTHGYRLPSKWISSDGRTMHLIFSGVKDYDAFCVRKLTLEINGAGAP